MILKDLLAQVPKDKIFKRLIEIYPDQKGSLLSYFKVYDKLMKLTPKENEDNLLLMVLPLEEYLEEGTFYDHVFGYSKNNGEHYALEFTSWEEWLGLEICKKSVEYYEPAGFLAHCFYEMTFVSFDEEEINDEVDKLAEMEKEIEAGTAVTYSMEEVYKELKIEYEPPTEEEMKNDREMIARVKERNDKVLEEFLSE